MSETILPAVVESAPEDTSQVLQPAMHKTPIVITGDQVDLIRATVAKDATPEELALYFYDCRRRGVHPLDRLIHYTKRGGRYTPVTSIDFLRSRAAETSQHAGTEDAVYNGTPGQPGFTATVTVWRVVAGERVPFTATARWEEYVPEGTSRDGKPLDYMWQKMKHGQLGKCAEALALRKGFPHELSSLYTFEEMDQASEEPRATESRQRPQRVASAQDPAQSQEPLAQAPLSSPSSPTSTGVTTVESVVPRAGKTNGKSWTLFIVKFADGREGATLEPTIAKIAQDFRDDGTAIIPTLVPGRKAGSWQLTEFAVSRP